MRTIVSVLGVLAVGGVLALSASARTAQGELSALDEHYLKAAAQGDKFEIIGGAYASRHGKSEAVRLLGRRLATDHAKSLMEVKRLAAQFGVVVHATPNATQQWQLGQVQARAGRDFDRAYTSLEVADHKVDIEEASEEASQGTATDVKSAAAKEIPTLKEHLKLARRAARAG
jgi:putative membrane protein